MAEIVISQQWLNSLTSYLNDLQTEAVQRAERSVEYLHSQVQQKARDIPGWEGLADEIEVWSADGMLHIGVSNKEFISQAWVLEYGDEHNSPTPLFRTLTDQVGLTNEFARTQASARYGPGNVS
jgi:hypothetical protein